MGGTFPSQSFVCNCLVRKRAEASKQRLLAGRLPRESDNSNLTSEQPVYVEDLGSAPATWALPRALAVEPDNARSRTPAPGRGSPRNASTGTTHRNASICGLAVEKFNRIRSKADIASFAGDPHLGPGARSTSSLKRISTKPMTPWAEAARARLSDGQSREGPSWPMYTRDPRGIALARIRRASRACPAEKDQLHRSAAIQTRHGRFTSNPRPGMPTQILSRSAMHWTMSTSGGAERGRGWRLRLRSKRKEVG